MEVDRCVCRDITFSTLKRLVEREGWTFEQQRERTGCGAGCGLCAPYILLMMRTGETAFPPMHPDEAARRLTRIGVEEA